MEKETKELIISHLDILIDVEEFLGESKYKLEKLLLIKELIEDEKV